MEKGGLNRMLGEKIVIFNNLAFDKDTPPRIKTSNVVLFDYVKYLNIPLLWKENRIKKKYRPLGFFPRASI